MPVDWIKLGEPSDNIEMRVIDLVAPIGKGQRALIVAPPRTGKTVMLKQIAKSITENHPDIPLSVLLVDE
jgi:transcription termination factor Rho